MTRQADSAALFRAGRPSDASAIRSILLLSKLSAPAVGDFERVTHSRIGEVLTFVVEERGQVVGVLQWRNLGEEAEILDVAVHPDHRCQGHASFLLKNFLQHISQSSVQRLFLEVRESNTAAIALYKKLGFQISGRRTNYYRNPEENALLMSLSLQA
jgi:[ribosomal protein S18]-alanine N-acetyltransferase